MKAALRSNVKFYLKWGRIFLFLQKLTEDLFTGLCNGTVKVQHRTATSTTDLKCISTSIFSLTYWITGQHGSVSIECRQIESEYIYVGLACLNFLFLWYK